MKLVNSFSEVDLKNIRMPVIVVYEYPADYPQHYVARVFNMDKPTDTIMLKDTLAAVQEDILENKDMVFIGRGEEDAPCIVGVWV